MQSEIDFKNRDVISITDFSREDILYICSQAKLMHDLEKSGKRDEFKEKLKNRSLSYMFFEPSTRTKSSFLTAMRELGGSMDGFSGIEGTSIVKKETIRDTIMMVCANHFDAIVMRNSYDGSVQWAADVAPIPVINGGDGKNEHPTQSLLDLVTIFLMNDGMLDGINLGLGGDLAHGRTIRSLSLALSHFDNITIRWAAEDALGMPSDLIELLKSRGVNVVRESEVENVMKSSDFYYMTRPQLERMHDITEEQVMEMLEKYRISLSKVKDFAGKLLHPLPVNSELSEINCDVYFHKSQGFYSQAENGVFTRKALLYSILKHSGYVQFSGKLSPELEFGNNKVKRTIKVKDGADRKFIDNISNGLVIDHLEKNSEREIAASLELIKRGKSSIPAYISSTLKSFLKTDLLELSERELKKIALLSKESTINYIRDGEVKNKFVYIICQNDNCITRLVNEDIPPKFYNDKGKVKCRYCRKEYKFSSEKLDTLEKQEYLAKLPNSVESVKY